MLRTLKKLLGKGKKDICPVCKTLTYFHDNRSYTGMMATDFLGPTGDITCGTCEAQILLPAASANVLMAINGYYYPGKDIKDITLTDEQTARILAIAI